MNPTHLIINTEKKFKKKTTLKTIDLKKVTFFISSPLAEGLKLLVSEVDGWLIFGFHWRFLF